MSLFNDSFFAHPLMLHHDIHQGERVKRGSFGRLGACDVQETEDAHIFHLDTPGMKHDDVTVEIKDGNQLHIHGKREARHESGEDDHKWHRIERTYGSFSRTFQLPKTADVDNIKAKFEQGELLVTVPKLPEKQNANRRIAIQ